VVEVWDINLKGDNSNPLEAFLKKCFSFSIIFGIILLYFIEIKTQYCSFEKLNIFFLLPPGGFEPATFRVGGCIQITDF
jgi:hypothetical protein